MVNHKLLSAHTTQLRTALSGADEPVISLTKLGYCLSINNQERSAYRWQLTRASRLALRRAHTDCVYPPI